MFKLKEDNKIDLMIGIIIIFLFYSFAMFGSPIITLLLLFIAIKYIIKKEGINNEKSI